MFFVGDPNGGSATEYEPKGEWGLAGQKAASRRVVVAGQDGFPCVDFRPYTRTRGERDVL
jgi:hypothetical protein